MNRSIEFYGLYRSTNTDFTSFFGFTANQSSRAQIRKKWHHRLSLSRSSIIETGSLSIDRKNFVTTHAPLFAALFKLRGVKRGRDTHGFMSVIYFFDTNTIPVQSARSIVKCVVLADLFKRWCSRNTRFVSN